MSLDDMGTNDSAYIQEGKLKRKYMEAWTKLQDIQGVFSTN